MTVGTLIYRMDEGMIDLDPPYQREVVWTQNQMRSFVETLWMDYPVPMIFMARQAAHGHGVECVDGKNRLLAIHRYVKGQFATKGTTFIDVDRHRWPPPQSSLLPQSSPQSSTQSSHLTRALQDAFMNKMLQVCTFERIDPKERRDFFQRIQMGVNLTSTERLHSEDHELVHFLNADYKANTTDYQQILGSGAIRRYGYLTMGINVLAMCLKARYIRIEDEDVDHHDNDDDNDNLLTTTPIARIPHPLTIAGGDRRCVSWMRSQASDDAVEPAVAKQYRACIHDLVGLVAHRVFPPKIRTQFVLDAARVLCNGPTEWTRVKKLGVLSVFADALIRVSSAASSISGSSLNTDTTVTTTSSQRVDHALVYATAVAEGATSAQYTQQRVRMRLESLLAFVCEQYGHGRLKACDA